METEIRQSLNLLMESMKRADAPAMTSEMERLDDLLARDRGRLDPRLAHFLERRSYAKALDFLGGNSDVPAGACGGRPAKG
jgi:hypothetical protein